MTDKLEKSLDSLRKLEEKIEVFSEILDNITTTEDKKKLLWKDVYENALKDRENANMMFEDAWANMSEGSTGHATVGPVITKYLERMSKSNEQILRLAELISKAEEQSSKIDPDDLFSEING